MKQNIDIERQVEQLNLATHAAAGGVDPPAGSLPTQLPLDRRRHGRAARKTNIGGAGMKRYWTIALVAVAVFLVVVGVWKMWRRTVPLEECSGIYQHYHDNPHIAATFLKDFRVNDTVTVDVTLLEAKDDEGWEEMREKINIKPIPQEVYEILGEEAEEDVWVWLAPKNNYHLPMDDILLNNDVLSVSRKKKQLCIFETVSEKQIDAISKRQFEEGHTDIHHNN